MQEPMACLRASDFAHIQERCAGEVDAALRTLLPSASAVDGAACGDGELQRAMQRAYAPDGVVMSLFRCAVAVDAQLHRMVPHLSWPQMRNLFCEHDDVGEDAHADFDRSTRLDVWRHLGFDLLLLSVLWLLLSNRKPLVKVHRRRWVTSLWWLALTALALVGTRAPPDDTRLQGFYYNDRVTRAAPSISWTSSPPPSSPTAS